MLYITKKGNEVGIRDTGIRRIGDQTDAGWTVVSPAVTDWFLERFWDLVDEEFFDFQTDNGIDSGDVPFDLDAEMHDAVEAMVLCMAKLKAWQLANMGVK